MTFETLFHLLFASPPAWSRAKMSTIKGRFVTIIFLLSACLVLSTGQSFKQERFEFTTFNNSHESSFEFLGKDAKIDGGALQLTPDTLNDASLSVHYHKSGRIMYNKPFRLWLSEDKDDDQNNVLASFNSTFLINIFRKEDWNAGHGLAFLIAPNFSIPEESHGQWLGLTNASTDGNSENRIVAIEFDTEKQDFDPDDNHIGLNVNSVRSRKSVSLNDYNITLSPRTGVNYTVWVQYKGKSRLMEVYMTREGETRPEKPILNETINLSDVVNQDSYFGFAASTGSPQIELNCVLNWSFEIDLLPKKRDRKWVKIGAGVGVPVAVISMAIIIYAVIFLYKKRQKAAEERKALFPKLNWLPGMPREFKYRELKKATNNFHESMKLGEGGFGIVYKGVLPENDSTVEVAVKKFSRDSIKSKDDFRAELTIIHRLRHKHLVRLVGWCYEKGKLLLVYDYMPNGSLDKHLYDTSGRNTVNWQHRFKILTGIASALHYLHNEYDQRVVHRDLKASNIMLDVDYNARLGDFGLARALENERNSYTELGLTGVPGTMGYVAPECFHTGSTTRESDIFGFGAVVLEVICGRSPGLKIEHEHNFYTLVDWVWMLHRERRIEEAVDEKLHQEFVTDEAKRLLLLGLACSHPIASERPPTQDIFQIITGTLPVPHVPPFKPVFQWPSTNIPTSFTDTSYSALAFSSLDVDRTRSSNTK